MSKGFEHGLIYTSYLPAEPFRDGAVVSDNPNPRAVRSVRSMTECVFPPKTGTSMLAGGHERRGRSLLMLDTSNPPGPRGR